MNPNVQSISSNPEFNKNMAGLPLNQYKAVAALIDAQVSAARSDALALAAALARTYASGEQAADRILTLCAQNQEPSSAPTVEDKIGNTDHVGRDLDDMPQPYAGAIVLLETIAECGARPYIGDDPTHMRGDCYRFAKELREAGREAAAQSPKVDYAQLTDALDLPDLSGPVEERVWQLVRLVRDLRTDKPTGGRATTSRHSVEGVVKFKRHSDHEKATSSSCICCPGGDHIFTRSVQWDAYPTNRPEHFGNGPEVFVSSHVTDFNVNEGRRVRLTVEVLGTTDNSVADANG